MKILISFIVILSYICPMMAQLNTELVAHIPYDERASDVWGYTAPDETEYAMIGLRNGVSIVSLSDAQNPQEVAFLEGELSRWRDLHTFGHYAYVVADESGTREGLWVIDLSSLPDTVELTQPLITFDQGASGTDTLFNCHNIRVDENGFAYLTGCNINNGGVLIFDLNDDPENPVLAGFGKDTYSHDNYVRNDILFTSEIYEGQFGMYDVSDKANPVQLAAQQTPYQFTHNVWLSDDGQVLFTTDERANAPVAAFDVSDPNDIFLLDEFRRAATLGTGVIPHNVHVKDDFLVISHYTDGCVIVDAHQPDNLVEVGFYDTNTDFDHGFHGAWGVYPFFPSGLIAVSDIENGLFIIRPEYVRASYLEGLVTNVNTGTPIANVEVRLLVSAPPVETTNLAGRYKTGLAMPGTFNVSFQAPGYFDQTILTTLQTGEVTTLNVQMVPLPAHTITGTVTSTTDGSPIPLAVVVVENDEFGYQATTDPDGSFSLPAVIQGSYNIYVGKWGYRNLALTGQPVKQNNELYFQLAPGYADDFNTDLDWQVSGDATGGVWERGIPYGTSYTNPSGETTYYNPPTDSPADSGPYAYVTGNTPVNDLFADQVDDGTTLLASPPMALLSQYQRPLLSYDIWWFTVGSNNLPNDTLRTWITNGTDTVMLEEYGKERRMQQWQPIPPFDLANLLPLSDNMRLLLSVGDHPETPNVVEAGLDNFLVREADATTTGQLPPSLLKLTTFPNPTRSGFTVKYDAPTRFDKLQIALTNALGQQMETLLLPNNRGSLYLGTDYPPGIYFVHLRTGNNQNSVVRVVKY